MMSVRFLWFALAIFILLGYGCAAPPQSFNSPDDAANALVAAARSHSTDQLSEILGGASEDMLASGDPIADRQVLDEFINRYDERHALVTEEDGRVSLVVGHNEWPMPIPLVQDAGTGRWQFDVEAGEDEIINRRIGRNELDAIEVCRAIVDAQHEYASEDRDGDGVNEYAARFMSDPGTRSGLYWPTEPGEAPSPMGSLAAAAAQEGYRRSDGGEPRPYHGYIFRILTAQGPHALDGARDYLVNGQLIGGFAVVAHPVDYGNSGIMTFVVNHRGVVYERDLGRDTVRKARSMTSYDCGPEWSPVAVVSASNP